MTVFKTAYDTTACAGYVTKRTADAIKLAMTHGFVEVLPGSRASAVRGQTSVENDIPAFAHPMLVDGRVVMDARPFGRWDNLQNEFKVRNDVEFKVAVHRASLTAIWINESPTLLRDVSQLPLAIYMSWVSEGVAKRFALEPNEQYKFAILCGLFYSTLFLPEGELQERDKLRVASSISRTMRSSVTDVLAVIDEAGPLPNLNALCQRSSEVCGSIRLVDLNVGLLYSILGGTWFGTDAKEMVAVALEHPPTWLAILVAAFNERNFKNSGITKLTERNGNKAVGQDYVRAVLNLLEVTSK